MTSITCSNPLDQFGQAESLLVTRDTLIVTYDPAENRLSVDPLGVREVGIFIRSFTNTVCSQTGATVFILDNTYHTCKSVAIAGTFSFSATSHREPNMPAINGPANIKAFEHWLTERGDAASAEELRKFFPKVFAPPPHAPARPKKRWWQR